jgi:hypothetical protein
VLPTSTSGQAQLGVNPTHPVQEQDDLAGLGVDIGDHLVDHRADNPFLQPRIGRRRLPDRLQVIGKGHERRR